MIRELRIGRFGRFADRTFAFAPVTVFAGPNESGKSTLFDALFAALCKPGARGHGALLRQRYGAYDTPEIVTDGESFDIEADEMMSLFAIRAGSFELGFGEKSEWLARVKSALFSGGIDPARIVAALAEEADERGNRRHMKAYNERMADSRRILRELEDLSGQRASVLDRQRRMEETAGRQRKVEEESRAAGERLAEIEAHLAQQRLARERERHARVLAELQRGEQAAAELAAAGAAADEEALGELHRRVEAAGVREAAARAAEAQAREERERAAAAAASGERELAGAREAAALAAELRRASEQAPALALAPAAAALAAGAAALAVVLAPLPAWARAGLGLLAAALAAFVVARLAGSGSRIRRMAEEWRRRGGPGELSTAGWAELRAGLLVHEGAAARLADAAAAAARELVSREAALAAAASALARAGGELAGAAAEEERWLRSHGAASVDDYRSRRTRRLAAQRLLEASRLSVAESRAAYGCSDDASLRAELDRRLRDLDAVLVESALPEPQVRRLEAERDDLQKSLAARALERERIKEAVDQERGGIRSSLGELPDRMVAKERELAICKADLAAMECARRAAALARDLFARIARDSEVLMEALAAEIADTYGDLVGEKRDVGLPAFDVKAARVVDAGGQAREMASLSSGTRDLFLLAARLTLAARSRPGAAVIVLDEPFQAIDADRAGRALALIGRFQRERGWQVVIMTKDEGLLPRIAAAFPQAQIHRLERS